jgi:hypothetical protein
MQSSIGLVLASNFRARIGDCRFDTALPTVSSPGGEESKSVADEPMKSRMGEGLKPPLKAVGRGKKNILKISHILSVLPWHGNIGLLYSPQQTAKQSGGSE